MNIVISNNAGKPIYEQITSQMKRMILEGELKAGEAIPSMRALAKELRVSVITVQKAYEDLQRAGFIETAVGRGSFVSEQDRTFYQREQERRAGEHLQAVAEIARMSDIPLEKLTELLALSYETEERRIRVKEFLLERTRTDGEASLAIVDAAGTGARYTLVKKQDSMLGQTFVVQSDSGDTVADIKVEHVLFTPGKLPKITVTARDGRRFQVKKEIEQLSSVIHVEGEDLTVKGALFSEHFELHCSGRCIGAFTYGETGKSINTDAADELMAVLFAFAIELAR